MDIVAIFLNLIWRSWEEIARETFNGARAIDKPLMVVWVEGKPEALEMLRKNDIPVYTEPTRCIKSIGALYRLPYICSDSTSRREMEPLFFQSAISLRICTASVVPYRIDDVSNI